MCVGSKVFLIAYVKKRPERNSDGSGWNLEFDLRLGERLKYGGFLEIKMFWIYSRSCLNLENPWVLSGLSPDSCRKEKTILFIVFEVNNQKLEINRLIGGLAVKSRCSFNYGPRLMAKLWLGRIKCRNKWIGNVTKEEEIMRGSKCALKIWSSGGIRRVEILGSKRFLKFSSWKNGV